MLSSFFCLFLFVPFVMFDEPCKELFTQLLTLLWSTWITKASESDQLEKLVQEKEMGAKRNFYPRYEMFGRFFRQVV